MLEPGSRKRKALSPEGKTTADKLHGEDVSRLNQELEKLRLLLTSQKREQEDRRPPN